MRKPFFPFKCPFLKFPSLQQTIEYKITQGLGYDSKTKFLEVEKLTKFEKTGVNLGLLTEEKIKNSEKGLKAHLFDLDSRPRQVILQAYSEYYKSKKRIKNFYKKTILKLALNYYRHNLQNLKNDAKEHIIWKEKLFKKLIFPSTYLSNETRDEFVLPFLDMAFYQECRREDSNL